MEEIDEKIDSWDREQVKKEFIRRADEFFDKEIKKKDAKKFAREWHRSLQQYFHYRNKNQILDVTQGPIANTEHFIEAKEGDREWEDVELIRGKKEIVLENQNWIEEHFQSKKA